MHMFRTKSREEKIINHLVGAGFFSSVPVNDVVFYRLAASCASVKWQTERVQNMRVRPVSAAEEERVNLADRQRTISEIADQPVDLSVVQAQGDNTVNNDVLNRIFKPKPSLPAPLFQQTFRRWKSSMDMELRFRRLRRLRASIVLQPLDEFPSFLADFQVHLRDRGHFGFFELLHEFMKVFFTGANICVNSTTATSAWDVTSRVHESTGKQQVPVLADLVLQNFLFRSHQYQYDVIGNHVDLQLHYFMYSVRIFSSAGSEIFRVCCK